MKWKEILLKALDYIKKYRALWYLGILAALTEGGGGGNFYNLNRSSGTNSNGLSDSAQSTINRGIDWISNNRTEVGVIILFVSLISLIILYISYSARAGLIYSVNESESKDKKPNFSDAFHAGQKYFWRFLGLTILIALMVFAVVFVLVGLIAVFVILAISFSLWFLLILIPLALLLILGIVVMSVYLGLVLILAYRAIVTKDKGITAAIREARGLIHHNFTDVILAWLIQMAIGVVVGIVMVVVAVIIGGALFALGAGIYFAGGLTAAVIYGSIAALAFVLLVLLLSGVVNAYISAYWTIVYRKLSAVS